MHSHCTSLNPLFPISPSFRYPHTFKHSLTEAFYRYLSLFLFLLISFITCYFLLTLIISLISRTLSNTLTHAIVYNLSPLASSPRLTPSLYFLFLYLYNPSHSFLFSHLLSLSLSLFDSLSHTRCLLKYSKPELKRKSNSKFLQTSWNFFELNIGFETISSTKY